MAEPASDLSVVVRIRGRVQGVWYRAWTVEQATLRGLRGWVRNRHDGSVEALICGPAAVVEDMIGACRHGPRAARVEAIERTAVDAFDGAGFVTRETE